MNRLVLEIIIFCTLAAFHGKNFVDSQTFNPGAGISDKYANQSRSVDLSWDYDVSSLASISFLLCNLGSGPVISKRGSNAATVTNQFNGKANVIDLPDVRPRKIGFTLLNVQQSDAKEAWCTLGLENSNVVTSGKYMLKIYVEPLFLNCLMDGTTLKDNVATFVLREGQAINSTCFVSGNPVPDLSCLTLNSANGIIQQTPEKRNNFTVRDRMILQNVGRTVKKVRCIADGRLTGRIITEAPVLVQYVPSAPLNLRLAFSTYSTIKMRWTAPIENGNTEITDYLLELSHPNGTQTSQNKTLIGINPLLEYTFHNLFWEQQYSIRISAYNRIGRGTESAWSNQKTVPANPDAGGRSGSSMSTGSIVGIVFGVLAGIVLILIIVFFVLKKRQEKQKYPKSYVEEAVDYPSADNAMYSRVKKKPMEVGVNESTSGYPDIIHQVKATQPEKASMVASHEVPQRNAIEKSRKEYV